MLVSLVVVFGLMFFSYVCGRFDGEAEEKKRAIRLQEKIEKTRQELAERYGSK